MRSAAPSAAWNGRRSPILARRSSDLGLKCTFIGQAPLFRGLSTEERAEVASLAEQHELRRREVLAHQGEPASETSLVGVGRLKITQLAADGQEVLIRLVGPGEMCAGLGVRVGGLHPTSTQALEVSQVLSWPQDVAARLLERFPVLSRNALRIQTERLRMLEEAFRELATQRVPQRLARTLVRLVGHVGRPCEDGVKVALSREELAQMVGTTLFTVSRLLSEWESDELVLGRRQAVIVRDLGRLMAFSQGTTDAERTS